MIFSRCSWKESALPGQRWRAGLCGFWLLGAEVTVVDLSDVQLARDREGAAHHGLQVTNIQGDMRDLSMFPADTFDVVWQPYSVNFVPSVEPVYNGVARVLKPGGIYYMQFANPFIQAVDDEAWDGEAYPSTDLISMVKTSRRTFLTGMSPNRMA